MDGKDSLLPHYSRRIEDLRDFRNRYDSIISKVREKGSDAEVDLPEAPERDLETLNRDLRGRMMKTEEKSFFVPKDKNDELLVEMEAIADYSDDRIKVLKRRELIVFTVVTTFTIIFLINVFNIPFF